MSKHELPIACDLDALADKTHHQTIGAQLMTQAQSLHALTEGYRIDFPISTLTLAAEFVDGERRCCPFLCFQLRIEPAAETLQLHVTGSAEIKAFLTGALLPSLAATLTE